MLEILLDVLYVENVTYFHICGAYRQLFVLIFSYCIRLFKIKFPVNVNFSLKSARQTPYEDNTY